VDAEAAAGRWVEGWTAGWRAKDPDAIAALYAAHHVYRSHPFREPEAGAREYALRAFGEEELVECRFGAPVVAGDRAAVEYHAILRERGTDYTLAGVALVRFDADGLVTEHRDYWAMDEGRRPPAF
jgi:hypothetical protein